ncbi:methyltransferase-domain-containing protein [Butyriboletus roseoflavus]|nr:methyltransferase-domain-containing protein [Butyriboletus roseoflavus]
MMKEDPNIFEDVSVDDHNFGASSLRYSTMLASDVKCSLGHQIQSLIADLGCGDAALARALLAKNLIVLSFDLVSDGAFVTEADICSQVPLPGSEPQSAESIQGEAQVVDVVVCALSLMSTNWPRCISEAWRILRPGDTYGADRGELMIAEVASRFTSVNDFTSLINSIGFKLQEKVAAVHAVGCQWVTQFTGRSEQPFYAVSVQKGGETGDFRAGVDSTYGSWPRFEVLRV